MDVSENPALVVLAAGMGSRYNGLKQLDGFGTSGETIIDYTLYDAIKIGFSKVVFVIRKDFEEQFRQQYINKIQSRIKVEVVFQNLDDIPSKFDVLQDRTKPWGTGHAVLLCKEVIHEPFVIVNADDLYGRSALQLVFDYIGKKSSDQSGICLAGYSLNKTLSSNGGVSRGICETDADLKLVSIEEAVEIEQVADGQIVGKIGAESSIFTGNEVVSMNLIGMTGNLFSLLKESFHSFLSEHSQDLKAEYYLPDFINSQIGKIDVQVLKTDSVWSGVTYRSDKPLVEEHLKKLVDEGIYPDDLWK